MSSPPRIYKITFTVPAHTPQSVPFTLPWVTEDARVIDIELIIPPGHNGLTGFRIMKGDVPLIPFTAGTFIVANNYTRTFAIGEYIPTQDVKLQGFNTGNLPHSFYLHMAVENYEPAANRPAVETPSPFPANTGPLPVDPLSPDAILGPDAVTALLAGDITADDLQPIPSPDLTVLQTEPADTADTGVSQ